MQVHTGVEAVAQERACDKKSDHAGRLMGLWVRPEHSRAEYQEDKNVRFEVRYADENPDKLTRNARDLAAANVDVYWVPGSGTAEVAHTATAMIPIVFAIVSDPVRSGFVKSLASPGTNMTGLSLMTPDPQHTIL